MLQPPPKAIIFDLMGTCTDWKSSLLPLLRSCPTLPHLSPETLADEWRAGFFEEIHRRFLSGDGTEDIDVTHRRVLDRLLEKHGAGTVEDDEAWSEELRNRLVKQWHVQLPWPDSISGLEQLKEKFFVVVLANGTTRLQLDIVTSSRLSFHTLLSSQLLGLTKPDPKIYLRALELLSLKPEETVMVAAHAYDLRAAAEVGIRTMYVRRETEDRDEDLDKVEKEREFDWFVEGRRTKGEEGGLVEVARLLGA
ncbi:haloacid dehalogenase [Meredithblackwellia eburnea MCA 4105]